MIGYRSKNVTFEPRPVLDAEERASFGAVTKACAFVMVRARSSIRKRLRPAAEGQPPSSHDGTLKRFIRFAVDRQRRSGVVGAMKLSGKIGNAPEALEKSGPSQLLVKRQGQRRIVGSTVRKHPYMQPALDAELPRLPGLWQGSIRR